MHLRLNESEVREAVKDYIARHYNVNVTTEQLQPIMVKYGEFDDTERVMEGYQVEIPKGTTLSLGTQQ